MASLKKRISAVFPELCLREDLPYRELTTLGVGTVLPLMAEPADDRQLQRLLKLLNSGNIPFFVFGGGSNIIGMDGPYNGVGIRLRGENFDFIRKEGTSFVCGAGAFLPETWSFMNAGIGGDDLPRLAKRLQCKARTYRLEHFEHIWDKIPDDIFLFYGANDSKANWRDDYKFPGTSLEEEKRCLEDIWQVFQEKAPRARVTVISAAPGYHPYQLERNGRLRERKIQHTLFGIPEHIKNFNRAARDFAAGKGWNYLDFHRVCAAHGDLKSLFIPDDGVHMTLTGHQVLAAALLEYLQK